VAGDASPSEDWYVGALQRIERFMTALGVLGLVIALALFGWRIAVGFALGSLIAYLNFHWLEKMVEKLGDVTVQSGVPGSGRGITQRFLLRYLLLALLAFVILRVSREILYGLFAGLFLPVGAMLCEAVYQTCVALARGT
jgi:ATP synthase I chain